MATFMVASNCILVAFCRSNMEQKHFGTQNIGLKSVFHTVHIIGAHPSYISPPELPVVVQSRAVARGPDICRQSAAGSVVAGAGAGPGGLGAGISPGASGQSAANTSTGLLTVSSVLLTSGNHITTSPPSPLLNTGFSSVNLDPLIL